MFSATDIGLVSLRVHRFKTASLNVANHAQDTSLNKKDGCPEAYDRLISYAEKMQSSLEEEEDFVFFVIVPSDIVTST